MNLSKIRWGAFASVALAVPLMGQVALAQSQQICIVEPNSSKVVCGRVATNREISNARGRHGHLGSGSSRHGGHSRHDGGLSRNGDRRYETASNRRDWSDVYDELDDIYKEVLGRNIGRNGLRTYVRRLEQGWSLARIRQDVAESNEAETALDQLYRRILGRGVDPAGSKTYRHKLARGSSLRDVARDLQKSDEARGR